MSQPKPEHVEIGQWWLTATVGLMPFRIERLAAKDGVDVAFCSSGCETPATWYLINSATYLGCGENPEPSEQMIDMLIDAMSEIETGGSSQDEPHIGRYDRTNYRRVVFSVLANQCADLAHSRVIGVTYRLLRSLGKW